MAASGLRGSMSMCSRSLKRWIQSACVLCSNGCGIDIGVKDGRIVGVRGREVDRVNKGRLGPKGLNGWEANNSPDRLIRPLIRRGKNLEEATWEEAMALITEKSKECIDRYTSGMQLSSAWRES
jgi:anaerobic selenocysteine-containing dehydrogenase